MTPHNETGETMGSEIVPVDQRPAAMAFDSIDEWLHAGVEITRRTSWLIGDWWRYAIDNAYPATSRQEAAALVDLSLRHLDNLARTAAVFPPGVRDEGVSFSTHRALAAVKDPVAALAAASSEGWSKAQAEDFARAEAIAALPTKPAALKPAAPTEEHSPGRATPTGNTNPEPAPTVDQPPEPAPTVDQTHSPERVPATTEPTDTIVDLVDRTELDDANNELERLRTLTTEQAAIIRTHKEQEAANDRPGHPAGTARLRELEHENQTLRDTLESLRGAQAQIAERDATIESMRAALAAAQSAATAPVSRRTPPPVTTARLVVEVRVPGYPDKATADRVAAQLVELAPKFANPVAKQLDVDPARVEVVWA